MEPHQPKKGVPTGAELEARLVELIRHDKILQAVMLYQKAYGLPRGPATKAVEDIRRRISAP